MYRPHAIEADRAFSVAADRRLDLAWTLWPREADQCGWVELTATVAADIRTAAQIGIYDGRGGVAIGLGRIDMLAGRAGPNSWTHPFSGSGSAPVRTEPDGTVPVHDPALSSTEISRKLVTRLSLRIGGRHQIDQVLH